MTSHPEGATQTQDGIRGQYMVSITRSSFVPTSEGQVEELESGPIIVGTPFTLRCQKPVDPVENLDCWPHCISKESHFSYSFARLTPEKSPITKLK